MARKVEVVDVQVKSNVDESIKGLKELKRQLKETAVGSAEFKRISNEIDDLEDKIAGAKKSSGDWVDQLAAAPGPLGMVGKGINSLKVSTVSFGAALKAAGIGLLVSLIGGVAAAFSSTEGAGKKLQPLLIGMEKIFNGIYRALEPVFNTLIELATQAMPYVTKAFGVAYSAMTSFLQGLGMLGRAIGKLISGDFTGAWEDAKGAVTGFGKRYDEANARFIAGTQEVTKTEKKNLEDRSKAREEALAKRLKEMEAEDALDEAKMQKMKAEALALAQTEQEKLDIEKKFAQLSYNAKVKDLEDKMKLYKKDSVEYKNLLTEKTKVEGEYITQTAEFAEKQKTINENTRKETLEGELQDLESRKANGLVKEEEYQKLLFEIKKKYAKDDKELKDAQIAYDKYLAGEKKKQEDLQRQQAFQSIQDQIDNLDKLNQKYENDFQEEIARLEEKKKLLQQQRDLELAAVQGDEQKKLEIRQKYAKQIGDVETQITNTQRAQIEARTALQNMYADTVGQFGQLLQQVAGKNKALAKAGLIVEQAAGVAKVIINTQAAAAKIAATSPLGFLDPRAVLTYVQGGISVATAVAATVKGIKQIDGADAGGGGGSSAGGQNLGRNYEKGGMIGGRRHAQGGTMIEAEAGEAIMTRGAVTMFGPLLSALNQAGGGASFAPNIVTRPDAAATANPAIDRSPVIMKTYVVENELTTEQQKQARLKELSTL